MSFRKRFLQTMGDLLWPPMCATCSRLLPLEDSSETPEAHFCTQCLETIEFMSPKRCPLCGRLYNLLQSTNEQKLHSTHICGYCLIAPPLYHSSRSALIYKEAIERALKDLKYGGHLSQVAALVSLAREHLIPPVVPGDNPHGQMPDAIVPMPLSRSRLAQRGFNQATELAREIYKPWVTLINEKLLIRIKDTIAPQASLKASQRRKAIRGSFKTKNPEAVRGLRILLFDDVLTTGSTAGEAAKTLLEAGAAQVDLATIARTLLGK